MFQGKVDVAASDKGTSDDETIEDGSGNLFADLALPSPEERLAKVRLAGRIAALIEESQLTQKHAEELLGIDQAKISKLVRGGLGEFSTSTLLAYLRALGQDIEIIVRPKEEGKIAAFHVRGDEAAT